MSKQSLSLRSDLKQLIDVGDIIGVSGDIKKTDRGEVSVAASRIQILTKSLRPLPDKWKGLADVEKRYRQRCVRKGLQQHAESIIAE